MYAYNYRCMYVLSRGYKGDMQLIINYVRAKTKTTDRIYTNKNLLIDIIFRYYCTFSPPTLVFAPKLLHALSLLYS